MEPRWNNNSIIDGKWKLYILWFTCNLLPRICRHCYIYFLEPPVQSGNGRWMTFPQRTCPRVLLTVSPPLGEDRRPVRWMKELRVRLAWFTVKYFPPDQCLSPGPASCWVSGRQMARRWDVKTVGDGSFPRLLHSVDLSSPSPQRVLFFFSSFTARQPWSCKVTLCLIERGKRRQSRHVQIQSLILFNMHNRDIIELTSKHGKSCPVWLNGADKPPLLLTHADQQKSDELFPLSDFIWGHF